LVDVCALGRICCLLWGEAVGWGFVGVLRVWEASWGFVGECGRVLLAG